jgi:uncharacterized membrane protein YgcG
VAGEDRGGAENHGGAANKMKPLSIRQRRRVERAVDDAENLTGLQLCIFLGAVEGEDLRAHAEQLFVKAGLHARPAVMLLVAPPQRRVEVVTSPDVLARVPDAESAGAVDAMIARFKDGDLAGGLIAGIEHVARAAGPGTAGPDDEELPDVLSG